MLYLLDQKAVEMVTRIGVGSLFFSFKGQKYLKEVVRKSRLRPPAVNFKRKLA